MPPNKAAKPRFMALQNAATPSRECSIQYSIHHSGKAVMHLYKFTVFAQYVIMKM